MSTLKVDQLEAATASTITVPSGQTLDISSATLTPPATMPASSAANLTSIPAANITGTIAAVSGANLTNLPAANVTGVLPAGVTGGSGLSALNATNLTSGTMPVARFPDGTVVGSAISHGAVSVSSISTTNSSFENSGITVAYTTVLSSSDSYILVEWFSNMTYRNNTVTKNLDVVMRPTASDSTSYSSGESITPAATYRWYEEGMTAQTYTQSSLRMAVGTNTGMDMPDSTSSWAAGTALTFRLFFKVSGGTFLLVHGGTSWMFKVTEVSK